MFEWLTFVSGIAPASHPALPLPLHVKQIHGIVGKVRGIGLPLVVVIPEEGLSHGGQADGARVGRLDVHRPVQLHQGDVVGVALVEGRALVISLILFLIISYVKGVL